ncbi:MAG TPA: tagatose 1,6-diphosphate aldolase [Candidatus Solibacter sp.]|jgi:tagatose 1,6-diphosphate aldolase
MAESFHFLSPGDLQDDAISLQLVAAKPADSAKGWVPYYVFHILSHVTGLRAGEIHLRLGDTEHLRLYGGHVAYGVRPEYRGRHFAGRALLLVIPLARRHGLSELWITCNPENVASRKTCEFAGAEFVEIVDLPPDIDMYQEGERQKCRYRLDLYTRARSHKPTPCHNLPMKLSDGKLKRMKALSNQRGIIAAAAMDQRGSLQKALAGARGVDIHEITPAMMSEFKVAVTRVLTPHASAILLDPEFGLEAAAARAPDAGLLLAYELSGYDNTRPGRLPDLLPHVSVKRIVDWGADAVKILIYYSPFDDADVKDIKHAFIERIGAECETYEIPFFLEFVGYDPKGGDERGLEFARQKPEIVKKSMEVFSRPEYRVDILKVEVPINAEFVEGSSVYKGQKAYTREEALKHFREAAAVAGKPFIYLSAGVSNAQFVESLAMASEAGTDYSGVLCGRATWKDGIPIYGKQGVKALEEWLQREGVRNINAVNAAIQSAKPWYAKLGIPVDA